jgi:hypothetical protein
MRTEQVQLEDWVWAALHSAAARRGVEISDLIRSAIEEKYLQTARERVEAFRAWQAPWRDRADIGDSTEYVRQLREDDRLDRLYQE